MADTLSFTGQRAVYLAVNTIPFAYGRTSVFFHVASESQPGEPMCIKLFRSAPEIDSRESATSAFEREVTAQAALVHPNILRVIDYGMESPRGGSFLVMPYCGGGNLRELLAGRAFLPLGSALPLLRQIGDAVDFAHGRGVIHGDIKPENILLNERRDHGYLSDFGLAKFFAFVEKVSTLAPSDRGGTTVYLPPELLRGHKPSTKSDVYAFGLVAYELLTGSLPFNTTAPLYEQLTAKVNGQLIDPRERNPAIGTGTAEALMFALKEDPGERLASAGDLCALLDQSTRRAVSLHVNVAAPPAPQAADIQNRRARSEPRRSWSAKEKLALLTAIVTAVAGLGTAVVQALPAVLEKLLSAK